MGRTAIDYLEGIGMEAINAYEQELLAYAMKPSAPSQGCAFSAPPGKGRRHLLQPRRGPSPRYRHHSRPGRHRHSHRPPLRAARDGALWRTGHGASVIGLLQYNAEIDALVAGIHKVKEVFG